MRLLTRAIEVADNALRTIACRAWVEDAFRDFIALDGRRDALLSAMARHLARLASRAAEARDLRSTAGALLDACLELDDGNLGHRQITMRSYVDVSIQVLAARAFITCLASMARIPELELGAALVRARFASRTALIAHGELLLEAGEVDAAAEAARRALRLQVVCPTAQGLLARAQAALGSPPDYDLTDRFCPVPFTTLATGYRGAALACSCAAWLPYEIGNVLQAQSVEEVWNSPAALEIRRSVLDGDFSYCSRTLCPYIAGRELPARAEITDPTMRGYIEHHTTRLAEAPSRVDLNYDQTCNLACPSCRTEVVSASREEQAAHERLGERVILPLLRRVRGQVLITGGGDPFASRHYRSVLRALNREEFPGLEVILLTNGLLLTRERWSSFPRLAEMIGMLLVSIDAARPETYEQVRRPGKWSTLLPNLELCAELRRSGAVPYFKINFVVQKANFREMREFVALGERLGVDQVYFQRLRNYGSYDEAAFLDADVADASHPQHGELLEILADPVLRNDAKADLLLLLPILPEVPKTPC